MGVSINSVELVGGFALSLAIGLLGYWRGALKVSGVGGAVVTGTLIFGLGGWAWGALLIAFFISSSALSFYRAGDKEELAEKFAKGHRRDLGQALANGGVAALAAVFSRLFPPLCPPQSGGEVLWFAACAGALSAVTADTWATELGVLSPHPPRLITTGKQVDIGTSGGVTWLGTAASLAGAAFIGSLAGLILGREWATAGALLLAAAAGGLAGSLFDSLLGATVQAIYWCDTCQKETERKVHRCGTDTHLLRGWPWLGNDLVNFFASAVGALVAAGVGWVLLP